MKLIILGLVLVLSLSSSMALACLPYDWFLVSQKASKESLIEMVNFVKENYEFEVSQVEDNSYYASSINKELCQTGFTLHLKNTRIEIGHDPYPNYPKNTKGNSLGQKSNCEGIIKEIISNYQAQEKLPKETRKTGC